MEIVQRLNDITAFRAALFCTEFSKVYLLGKMKRGIEVFPPIVGNTFGFLTKYNLKRIFYS